MSEIASDRGTSEPERSTEADPISEARLIAIYQAQMSKWVASRALLWQFPALTLSAQAFLIGAATQLSTTPNVVQIILAATILVIGVASIMIQFKSGSEARLDLAMLDRLEHLIADGRDDLLLMHSASSTLRQEALTPRLNEQQRRNYLWIFRRYGAWPSVRVRISFTWAATQALVSVAGAAIGLFA